MENDLSQHGTATVPDVYSQELPPPTGNERRRKLRKRIAVASVIVFTLAVSYLFLPPPQFPERTIFKVEQGSSLARITSDAKTMHLVRSEALLQTLVVWFGTDRTVQAGDYYFDRPMGVVHIARMLARGDFNLTPIKVTFPEGFTRSDMLDTAQRLLARIGRDDFLKLTENKEGYLFPDTYLLSPETTALELAGRLSQNYETKVSPLRPAMADAKRSEQICITMASIVEKEANGDDDRAIIAGILWKRLDGGMRLEVDAPFMYITGKDTVSAKDRTIDSPYNTYTHKGLPPTPIGNPGLASITAAVYPKDSPYFFYLHDKDGVVHYAKTFAEHKQNIAKYLK